MSVDVYKIRKAAKISQNRFAQKIGCALSTVQKWENGQSSPNASYEEILLDFHEKTLFFQDVKEPEIKLIKSFYSASGLMDLGYVKVRDIIDILYPYCDYETCETYLRKWAQMGFYRFWGSVSCGMFLWDKLPRGYYRLLNEWEEEE